MNGDKSSRGLAPVGQSIGERFATIAAARNDSLAFRGPDLELTCQELNARANRLAHRLLAYPLPDDQPFAILADGRLHRIVAVLAALKAGRVYLVIDPANPPERVAAILRHAGADILLVDAANEARAAVLKPRPHHVIRVDADLSQELPTDPRVKVDPEAPALIFHTSGSTGRPKGVVHTRRSVLGNFTRHVHAFRITQDDRQTLLYQLSVYGGTRDLFNALLSGAGLHYFPVRELGVTGLADWLLAERATIYCSIVSVFRELSVTVPSSLIFPDLRLVKSADGCPEHRGRADFQVKIRGNRVDLTEIERHLLENAAWRQAAVIARPEKNGAPRFIAYVAGAKGTRLSGSASIAPRSRTPARSGPPCPHLCGTSKFH